MVQQHKTPLLTREKCLWIALCLSFTFMIIESIGGWLIGSLALISDAAHMFTDVVSLTIALTAFQISKKPADNKRTFGYYRFEILAAALNAIFLFLLSFYIFYEAFQRFHSPSSVDPVMMFVIALMGFFVNLIGMRLLHAHSQEQLNMKGAYLEAWADLVSSVGVMIAAVIIHYTGWYYVDASIAMAIAIWILPRTWQLLKESINILLEGVPEGIKLAEINEALLHVPGVFGVHDLHVWALTNHKISLTAHLEMEKGVENEQTVLQLAAKMLEEKFNITHTTIQIEAVKCEPDPIIHS